MGKGGGGSVTLITVVMLHIIEEKQAPELLCYMITVLAVHKRSTSKDICGWKIWTNNVHSIPAIDPLVRDMHRFLSLDDKWL